MSQSLFGSLPSVNFTFPSGNVTQDIFPSLMSTKYEVTYQGSPGIERDVVSKVASFGSQLGTLTDAVLALATDDRSPAVEKLRGLHAKVERIKAENRRDAEDALREAAARLRRLDRKGCQRVLADLARDSASADHAEG